jgi:transposase
MSGRTPEYKQLAQEAWDYRVKGFRIAEIAGLQGCSEATVSNRLRYWREEGSKEESETGQSIVEYHRELDLDRIISRLRPRIDGTDDEAMKLYIKLMERKARLIGEDSPVKVKVEQKTTTYRIEGVDLEALR